MQWDKVMEKCAYSNFKAITPKEFGNMEKQTKKNKQKNKKTPHIHRITES